MVKKVLKKYVKLYTVAAFILIAQKLKGVKEKIKSPVSRANPMPREGI